MTTRKILVATPTAPIAIDVNSSAAVSVTLSGARGANGYGVPVGGDTGAVLAKSASGDYLTSWLTTTAFGRGLLAIADAAGLRSATGLANVDNTADASKPVSTAQALAIAAAVAAEAGTRAAADTTLDGRLDVLEADPITATAVASGLAGKLAIASNLGDLNNASTARTNLGLGSLATQSGTFSGTSSGTNTGDQTITLTGDVTGSGTGSFAATVAANAITNAKTAQMAAATIKGNNTGATANPADLTAAQVRGVLALPTSTVAGRLARYTDTAGAQGQTAGLFEDASGNVGIGTTGPANNLDIQSAGSVFARLYSTNASGYASQAFKGTGREFRIGVGGASEVSIGVANKFYVYDATGAATRAVIDSAGNVGIGTSNPGERLEVSGAIRLGQSSSLGVAQITHHTNNYLYVRGGTGGVVLSDDSGINTARVADGAAGYFSVETGNGTERMRINASGNVGIGTAAPRVKLDVYGPVAVGSYTVATVPSAALGAGQIIYVSNESGGATLAVSNGTNWRRTSDNAIIS